MLVPFLTLVSLTWILPLIYKNKAFNIFVIFFVATCICGTRERGVGVDTNQYYAIYNQLYSMPFSFDLVNGYEPGFRMIAYVCSLFTDDPALFLCVIAAITFLFIGYFIYKNTNDEYYWIACFLFVCLGMYSMTFNAVRQYLAIAIGCNCLRYINSDKYIAPFIIVGLAVLFHKSLIILFPVVALAMMIRKINRIVDDKCKVILIIFGGMFIICLGIVILGGALIEEYFQGYMMYFSSNLYANAPEKVNLMMLPIELAYFLLVILCIVMSKNKREIINVTTVSIFVLFSVLSFVLTSTIALAFYRIEFIFSIYACVLASYYFDKIKGGYKKRMQMCLLVICGYVTLLWMLITSYNGVSI